MSVVRKRKCMNPECKTGAWKDERMYIRHWYKGKYTDEKVFCLDCFREYMETVTGLLDTAEAVDEVINEARVAAIGNALINRPASKPEFTDKEMERWGKYFLTGKFDDQVTINKGGIDIVKNGKIENRQLFDKLLRRFQEQRKEGDK